MTLCHILPERRGWVNRILIKLLSGSSRLIHLFPNLPVPVIILWRLLRPISIDFTVTFMFHNLISSLARSRYLSLFSITLYFTLCFTVTAKANYLETPLFLWLSLVLGVGQISGDPSSITIIITLKDVRQEPGVEFLLTFFVHKWASANDDEGCLIVWNIWSDDWSACTFIFRCAHMFLHGNNYRGYTCNHTGLYSQWIYSIRACIESRWCVARKSPRARFQLISNICSK